MNEKLSMAEQGALIETIGATPLGNVVAGSVTAEPLGEDQALVRWVGVAIIPRIQYESVIRVVEAETRDRELAEGAQTDD